MVRARRANQQWELLRTPTDSGEVAYKIKSRHSGQCIGFSSVAPPIVVSDASQRDCRYRSGGDLWVLHGVPGGTYKLESARWRGRYLTASGEAGRPLTPGDGDAAGSSWYLQETKLPYSTQTAGVSVPWFQTREESALCEAGWHVQKDAGTNNPRYEYMGDGSMSSVQGRPVERTPPQNNVGTLVYVNPEVNQGPRRISTIYGNGSLPLQSRTGRVRLFCEPD